MTAWLGIAWLGMESIFVLKKKEKGREDGHTYYYDVARSGNKIMITHALHLCMYIRRRFSMPTVCSLWFRGKSQHGGESECPTMLDLMV